MLRWSSRAGLCLADKQKQHCRIWCHADGFSVGTNDSDESVAANSCGTLVACPSAILPTLSPGTQQCSYVSPWEHQTSQRLVMTIVRLEWCCCSVRHCNIVFWILFSLPSLISRARWSMAIRHVWAIDLETFQTERLGRLVYISVSCRGSLLD